MPVTDAVTPTPTPTPTSTTTPTATTLVDDPLWWRSAVIYQVYVRSFADSDGDGTGDLRGVRSRLGYLRELGVDALWFNPWYPSPMADGGYDVCDYRDIHPSFGTLADAELLIAEALALGIRTIIDVVPNHVSSEHRWFRAALAAGPGSPERERFWFHPGKGAHGDEPPTHWVSNFQGETWTRTTNADGTPGEWYLHLFTPEQPDLNWNHPEVRREHEEILRFWFDRGVAGVRIDSAGLLIKDPALPELPSTAPAAGRHPTEDRDEVHDVYRAWRRIADSYEGSRVLVGEVWVPDAVRFAAYLRPDEMHTAFNFDFMSRPWDAAELRGSIDLMLAAHAPVGAPSTWVLSNHDVTRPVTRYGRADSSFAFATKRFGTPTDLELGRRRARAAALLTAALPGSLYLYQGDELGLPEVELPRDVLEDPMHFRSGGVDPGRDGCRVPLPWRGTEPPFGFSPTGPVAEPVEAGAAGSLRRAQGTGATPWLPQPAEWAALTVQAQEADPASMLWLYRQALRIRKREPALGDGSLTWLPSDPTALVFRRGDDFVNVTNLDADPVPLPDHDRILLASAPLVDGMLPPDSTAWLHRPA